MVSWGMGHNLEKNLERVRQLRSRGQLDRALKSLQDWAEKHPDTPHYQFEAAMVAFEIRDWSTGIGALRSLMRALPETREKVLGACREQFDDVPALPLAEFLIENALLDQDLATATQLVDALDEENRGVYLRKLTMRQRSLNAEGEPLAPKALNALTVQFLLGCSLVDGARVRECVSGLVRESHFEAREWSRLIGKALKQDSQNCDLLFASATSLFAEHKFDGAGESLVQAARLAEPEVDNALSLLHSVEPDDAGRGHWYLTEGHLHLLKLDGTAAADSWTRAADANPRLREQLLDGLARPSENSSLPGREDALKLRLRLLVVQEHFDQIPELARRLVAEGLAEAGELRALLGEGQDKELPVEMTAVLAEIALRDGDIVAAAGFAYEIPTSDDHSCRRLLRAIDAMVEGWEEETRLQLFALRAALRARIQDRTGANSALATAWLAYPDEVETLTAVTDRCLEQVEALPELLTAAMGVLLDAGDTRWLVEPFTALCPGREHQHEDRSGGLNFTGADTGSFSQHAMTLDLGGEEDESYVDELAPALLELLRAKPARGPAFLEFIDGLQRPDLEPPLRQVIALAALHAGESKRALPAFALLTMMADGEFLAETAADFDRALQDRPDDVDLLLARAELDIEQSDLLAAAGLLDRALRLAPGRANEVVEAFDRMLGAADESLAPRLQTSLAEALFEVRCFDRLAELCDRILRSAEGSAQVPYLRLQVRMAIASGDFSGALQLVQQHSVKGPMPASTGVELLEEILEANPGSSISWLMLGQLATRASMLSRALEAYVEAIRVDPSLEQPVAEQIHEMSSAMEADTDLLIGVARFHLGRKAQDRAAYAFSRAMELDATAADRILGELDTRLEADDCDLDLLEAGAKACRLSGHPERAAAMLMGVESRQPSRLEGVLAEFRDLRKQYPELILPVTSMAEVLWRRESAEAALRIVSEAAAIEAYPRGERIAMLRRFHERSQADAGLSLSLAGLLADEGDRTEACRLIEASRDDDRFDPDRAAEVTGRLHRKFPEHAPLAILHHDLLVRCGRVDEALEALPPAGALEADRRTEVTRRFEQNKAAVLADPDLTLRFAEALVGDDRIADAIEGLEHAATHATRVAGHPMILEWARLLHQAGDTERSAAVLRDHFADDEARRAAFAAFGTWNHERTESELESLRGRFADDPQDLDCALEIAGMLLEIERAAEAREILAPISGDPTFRARRAILLGRAHLDLERAEDAEAILLDAIGTVTENHENFGEIQYHLAKCAGLLGRPHEATARLRGLLADPRYADHARARVRTSYADHLSEVAGERRAVLTAVSSLQSNPSRK